MTTGSRQKRSRRGLAGGGGKAGQSAWRGNLVHSHCSTDPAPASRPRHGKIEGNTWRKVAQGSRHQLRKPPSWAVDADDLEAAEALGVEWLEIHDTESGIVWSAPLAAFREHGVRISRGFGEQFALPLRFWSRRKVGETSAEASRQLQLALGGVRGGRK